LTAVLSIIIPSLNESASITATLKSLQLFRKSGHEIIVVDGGSTDNTQDLAKPLVDVILSTTAGRAHQMNIGAQIAKGDIFLFLHADTQLPDQADSLIINGLEKSGQQWGRFDVRLSGNTPLLRLVECLMNIRSRLTGIATGDQAIFVKRKLFKQIQGFPEISLMEDIAISRRLKSLSSPLCLREKVITSSRRWTQNGILRTILLMWRLRLAYFLGVNPQRLKRWYD